MKKINGIVKIGMPSYPIGVNGNLPCHQCYAEPLDFRETVRFFSEKQIEEYFAPRLEGMLARECREYIRGWCGDYKAILHGYGEYSCEELCNLLIDPWDPVRCLDYLGF